MEGHREQQNDSEQNAQRFERAEEFWRSIEGSVRSNIQEVFGPRFEQMRNRGDYEEAEIEEKVEEMVARERTFVTQVLSRVREAQERQAAETVVLFDIDETIGTPEILDSNTVITHLRPSLLPLLENIYSPNTRIGFLTSRSGEAVKRQLDDPQNLAPIQKYVNPAYIYSTEGNRTQLQAVLDERRKKYTEVFGGETGVIDENLLGRDDPKYDYPDMSGDHVKLMLLKELRQSLQGKAVVVVDDFLYPKYLSREKGFYGVSLRGAHGTQEGRFFKP